MILLVVAVCLLATGIIVSQLVKRTSSEEGSPWFVVESAESGQPITLSNVYLISSENGQVVFVYENETYNIEAKLEESYSGVGDLVFEDGKIKKVFVKPDSITGVLQSYTKNTITFKDNGERKRNENIPIYKISKNEVSQTDWNNLVIGVTKVKAILEEGSICALIIDEDIVPTDIRVVIKNGDSIFYSELYIKKNSSEKIVDVNQALEEQEEKTLKISDKEGLTLCSKNGDALDESYEGVFLVTQTENGLVLVNQLPVETYIKYVLPSEMPTYFNEEALKAQAICARTFALSQMGNQTYAMYGANLDDSAAFQVYHKAGRYEITDKAVEDTEGKVIVCNGELITCYFYSTSPGITNDTSAWGTEVPAYVQMQGEELFDGLDLTVESDFLRFLDGDYQSYDSNSPYYRWKATLSLTAYIDDELGALKKVEVLDRNAAGYVSKLKLTYENGEKTFLNESEIRKELGTYIDELVLNDGRVRTDMKTLPSACFCVKEVLEDKILLSGGGFGHGIGLSQYGANQMGIEGATCEEIIEYYFPNITIKRF